jgi:hypothetical protein
MKEKDKQVNRGRGSELIYNFVKKEVSSKLKKVGLLWGLFMSTLAVIGAGY